MAHSIQTFGSKNAILNDLDLMVIIGLLDQEANKAPAQYQLARSVTARWKADLAFYGPGLIDLSFDDVACSAEHRRELLSLLSALDETLVGLGETIDKAFLNASCSVPGVIFQDYPVALLKGALSQLRELLG